MRRTLTKAETSPWSHLKGKQLNGHHFRRQHPIGPYIADFACVAAKLVLEVDGSTHMSTQDQTYDAKRRGLLEAEGWQIMRVWNNQVYEYRARISRAIDEVVTARALKRPLHHASYGPPPPLRRGGQGQPGAGGHAADPSSINKETP
ncbi:hypothetical protein PsB1_1079 [Candidatus Phycosocius spiralis]|uniref:DUF559 domain-containing protein n=1 Tax=Candidatus Phycosocius spiralis TaxID=2815099 RepID=A0ABQ4PVB6_9PROT|nr:hypothetical protein PsB1_1079 [Candidatus Phycosocius spiralis]